MTPRPKLHEVGPLSGAAQVVLERTAVTFGGNLKRTEPVQDLQETRPASQALHYPETRERVSAAPEVREGEQDFGDEAMEAPPLEVLDEAVDGERMEGAPIVVALPTPPSAAPVKPAENLLLTAADKIEAACARLDVAVRAFVEDELKARFVGVWTAGA